MSDPLVPTELHLDEVSTWAPLVEGLLLRVAPNLPDQLRDYNPEYIEDAGSILVDILGRETLIGIISAGLSDCTVRFYHGTRLTDRELLKVKSEGLQPLVAADRLTSLTDVLATHPRWDSESHRLPDVLHQVGPRERAGRREDGCVHVCLSRAGLLQSCNHYLKTGAEVDGHAGWLLFGDNSADTLMAKARVPYLISFTVPFGDAVSGMNPYGFSEDLSNLPGILASLWAYRAAHPGFSVARQRMCDAARFEGAVTPERLTIEPVDDAQLV